NSKGPNTKIAAETSLGTAYYLLANLQSHVYVFQSLSHAKPVNFRLWGVGIVATMYEISQDLNDISANQNSVTDAVAFDKNEVVAGKSLASDANGPNASFNKMVL